MILQTAGVLWNASQAASAANPFAKHFLRKAISSTWLLLRRLGSARLCYILKHRASAPEVFGIHLCSAAQKQGGHLNSKLNISHRCQLLRSQPPTEQLVASKAGLTLTVILTHTGHRNWHARTARIDCAKHLQNENPPGLISTYASSVRTFMNVNAEP